MSRCSLLLLHALQEDGLACLIGAVLTGILFVLKTAMTWEQLSLELACGSGMTSQRRLREWQQAGVWQKLHRVCLDWLGEADQIDWSRAAIDSTTVPAPKGARRPDQIRRIAANRARSAMLWSTGKGFRWPSPSRRSLSTMGRCWNPRWMPSWIRSMRFRVLAFHAEKLYDERVWKKMKQVADWMAHRGIESTFFVYPFRAQVAKIDISKRVRALAALGHEIGQHTHFYAGTKIDGHDKVNDFSETNIKHCLRRDFETLCQIGVPPKGFTAGAWMINDTVLDALVKLGFTYDCSAHFPKPTGTPDSPYRRWLRTSQFYTNPRGSLLCLPTVCSLGEWFKWGWKVKIDEAVPYQLVYLHDYDLLSSRNYLPLWAFLIITGRNHFLSGSVLAKQFLNKAET